MPHCKFAVLTYAGTQHLLPTLRDAGVETKRRDRRDLGCRQSLQIALGRAKKKKMSNKDGVTTTLCSSIVYGTLPESDD